MWEVITLKNKELLFFSQNRHISLTIIISTSKMLEKGKPHPNIPHSDMSFFISVSN